MSNAIKVYLRVRPTKKPSGFIDIVDQENNRVDFNVPTDVASTHVNNTRSNYKFKFDGILDQSATQETVFNQVADDAIQGAIEGYNSTIFAYGQTGSGKTFTITGGAERYVDRGIIPRTLSKLFNICDQQTDSTYTIYISYLEIYNESGYDLLSAEYESAKGFENLPKVSMREDEMGNIHLKNLSMHLATREEDALNLLFLGDTNRAIAETPMNLASSRSHCIFTVSIEARQSGSETIKHSKLHIVDLAGSERVHKTHSSGKVLREAKYINSSLHYLEMVIVALHEKKQKGRQHIPYRNSLMTSILRDSLGGNSRTSMIATISAEASNTEESISTCRFAQRVALVENNAIVNEELDPSLMIEKLKGELRGLQEEVTYLKGENPEEELTDDEKERVSQIVRTWALARSDTSQLEPGNLSFTRIHFCFQTLKELVLYHSSSNSNQTNHHTQEELLDADGDTVQERLAKLQTQISQRDHEIAILVNMVKSGQQRDGNDLQRHSGRNALEPHNDLAQAVNPPNNIKDTKQQTNNNSQRTDSNNSTTTLVIPKFESEDDAFEWFGKQHSGAPALEENKTILRNMYEEAKAAAAKVNRARDEIQALKNSIDSVRNGRVVSELMEDSESDESGIREEQRILKRMDDEKAIYKSQYQVLKSLKVQIEQVKRILKAGRVKLQLDFDMWYDVMRREGVLEAADVATEYGIGKPGPVMKQVKQYDTRVEDEAKLQNEGKHDEGIPLTGNEEADADIRAFFKAKEQLLRKRRMAQQQMTHK